jgi:type III pantothenate kinase
MILCIDIGNTSIKLARVEGRRVGAVIRVPAGASAAALAGAVRRAAGRGIESAAIASVRPGSTGRVRAAVRRELGLDALVVSHRSRLPIRIATRRPARVGVDRICSACGALPGRARDAIVIDAGSAITVDLVLDRTFTGGLIMTGPQMMLSALHRFTAQLPDLTMAPGGGRFDDTVPAMLTGAEVASAGAILEAVRLLRGHSGGRPPVWLTGGHATRLSRHLPAAWKRVPDLTLIGLAAIADPDSSASY